MYPDGLNWKNIYFFYINLDKFQFLINKYLVNDPKSKIYNPKITNFSYLNFFFLQTKTLNKKKNL